MNAPRTMAKAKAEMSEALAKAGLVEGASLEDDSQLKKEKRVVFWQGKVENQIASEKETFVTFKVASVDPIADGDDGTASRNALAYVDLWTTLPTDSEKILKTLDRIEKALGDLGWSFEQSGQEYHDSSSSRNQLTYSAEKQY